MISGRQNVTIEHLTIDGNGASQTGNPPPSGIGISQSSNIAIKDVEVTDTSRIGIAMIDNETVSVLDSFIHQMNTSNKPFAVPAIWIGNSTPTNGNSLVWIGFNHVIGNANGPGGDGGINCYGSDQVNIYHNTSVNSGESAIYTAHGGVPGGTGCSNLSIWSNRVFDTDEWGIDITQGADTVFVGSNLVDGSGYAAMVFWLVNDVTVRYNTMLNGHSLPPDVPCRSIVIDSSTNVDIDGTNTVDVGPLSCTRP